MTKKKLTVVLFIPTIIVVNLFLFIVVSLYYHETYSHGTKAGIIYPIFSQLFWFAWLSDSVGFKVFRGGDWLPATTRLGDILIWLGIIIDLIVYYFLSAMIASLWLRYTHRK